MARVCILSGASSGIGLSLAKILLEKDYKIYGLSLSQTNWPAANSFTNNHPNFILRKIDVSNENEVKGLVDDVLSIEGKIDLLINNAGYIDQGGRIENISSQTFLRNFEVNTFSVFYMCKYAIPFMQSKDKIIINISSNAGKRAVPQIASYSASKFAVLGLSQSIAKENLDNGLKVICICPGGTNTPMRQKIFHDADQQQSADFVAQKIGAIIGGEIDTETGCDVVIRYGQVTVNDLPGK